MKKVTKILSLLLVLILSTTLLFGCGSFDQPKDSQNNTSESEGSTARAER